MIRLDNVSKQYSNRAVVDGLSLTCAVGKVTVLVGPSGCGKTTTLEMINGLTNTDSGSIYISDQKLSDANVLSLRRQIGYVIQDVGLFPHYSLYDNIAVVPRLLKWDEARIQTRVEEMMTLVGLPTARLREFPAVLSGGQQQRIGFARALAADPGYLLLDEPFSALDPITRITLQDEFLAIQQKLAKTAVLVTHDMDEALRLGDSVAIMHNGKILQHASPIEILRRPENAFVESFVGEERNMHLLKLLTVSQVLNAQEKSDLNASDENSEIKPSATLHQAIDKLITSSGSGLNVLDGQQHCGVITLRDIINFTRKED
ncbi:MAG: ABC transporter ATP-binding protein [Calditrichia bacterium]